MDSVYFILNAESTEDDNTVHHVASSLSHCYSTHFSGLNDCKFGTLSERWYSKHGNERVNFCASGTPYYILRSFPVSTTPDQFHVAERRRKYMHTLSLCTTPTLVGDVICSCLATAMVAPSCISAQRSAMPSAEAGKQVVIQSKRLQAARLGFDLHMRGHLGRAMMMMS